MFVFYNFFRHLHMKRKINKFLTFISINIIWENFSPPTLWSENLQIIPLTIKNIKSSPKSCYWSLKTTSKFRVIMDINYKGKTKCPCWIVSLNKLKKLKLESWFWCEIIPPLGMLPSLEILEIIYLRTVKIACDEFLVIESRDHHI